MWVEFTPSTRPRSNANESGSHTALRRRELALVCSSDIDIMVEMSGDVLYDSDNWVLPDLRGNSKNRN